MESLEVNAKTVEEAIRRALERLGVSREEVEVTVVREGRPGILGLGAEDAVVRVTPLLPVPENQSDAVEVARNVLDKLLGLVGVDGSVFSEVQPVVAGGQEVTVVLNIKGEDLGILIGRRGQTLACLQYIVRLMVGHQTNTWVPIIIDVEGYKQRRYKALQVFAENMAEQVKTRGTPFTMEPMPAYERRIIHLVLAEHPDVTTESTGLGEARRVVIQPRSKQ